jgi:arylsulfatase A-like enzyme
VGKQTAFDIDIRVPLIVAGPGVEGASSSSLIVQNVDLRPTLDSLAGIRPQSQVDGMAFLPLPEPGSLWRGAALIEHHGEDMIKNDPDYEPVGVGIPPSYVALRLPDATYVEYIKGTLEYYNLTVDPDQNHNVIRQVMPARLAELKAMIDTAPACRGAAACLSALSPSPIPTG